MIMLAAMLGKELMTDYDSIVTIHKQTRVKQSIHGPFCTVYIVSLVVPDIVQQITSYHVHVTSNHFLSPL